MEQTKEKPNMRDSINALEVGGTIDFPVPECKPNTIRNAASELGLVTGKMFRVNMIRAESKIVVTREA